MQRSLKWEEIWVEGDEWEDEGGNGKWRNNSNE